ncbi:MAG: export protein, partial [Deltaproteobacteria bacterium]|nr:export protein [Deltaproteobacteria bacterium]
MTHPSPRGALERWVGLCARRPLAALSLTLALAAAAVALALTLRVNTNQLEMISAASRQVRDIHRVTDMIGGAGHLTVALRGARPEALKAAAVDLAEHLTRDEGARVRDASYQLPTAFLLERAALFMETADLEELRRRVNAKLADAKRRADPFFFELEPTPPVALKVD